MNHLRYSLRAFLNLLLRPHLTGNIDGKTIVIDHLRISNANLTNCTLLYGGSGGEITFDHVRMEGGGFQFFGRAQNTVAFLVSLDKMDPKQIRATFPNACSTTLKELS